ncbi:MAG: ribonuclease Y [Patescibacteria group bacterium]
MIPLQTVLLIAAFMGSVGLAFGYLLRILVALGKKGSIELNIKEMMVNANEKSKLITLDAEEKAAETLKSAREEMKVREETIKKAEERVIKKEDFLDKRQAEIDKDVEDVKTRIAEIKIIKDKIDASAETLQKELERIATLSREQAKEELVKKIEQNDEKDFIERMHKLETFTEEKLEGRAKEILTTTIQRLASSVSADLFTTHVAITSDEVKGKIIGKEGRNIKAFERETGVEVVVDDTPGAITISCFDPIRRQIARMALEALIADGRIQPAKIEKEVERAKEEVNKVIKEKGEQAVYETGVLQLDPRIVAILGRLHYRTSYGQNVLQHSIECAHIAGMIASELGANVGVAKAGALLHDIGKAVDHEVAGTHVEIGRRILEKFGASQEIIKAMQAHHEEYPYETLESRIVQTADAISGGRPGARKDSIENYLKRLAELEQIANSFPGVEKSYALQAGREVRVFVFPDKITDLEAKNMARNIANRIQEDLRYPGEIKVNVVRELRAVEFAR